MTTPDEAIVPVSLTDLEAIRARAREHVEDGAVTGDYALPRKQVLDVLDKTLATEIVCALRYLSHVHRARGIRAEVAAAEFQEHADQEMQHMSWIAERIAQLGGVPDFEPPVG